MFGKNKQDLRMKAMDSMMRDKPMVAAQRPQMEEESEEEGMVSMAVTPEEQQMILSMRKRAEPEAEELEA